MPSDKRDHDRFVIQEHHATHLHWDFRLEKDNTLKSWAIPKGFPEKIGVRRLAVQVEDHPLEYLDFEGEIADGEYGAGTITMWDKGTYELLDWGEKRVDFILRGRRVKGRHIIFFWKDNYWLLMKRNRATEE